MTSEGRAYAPFLGMTPSDTRCVMLVEKASQLLYLFETPRWEFPLGRYICSTGQSEGTKRSQGDLKTPEGIYYMNRRMEDGELDPQYGIRAYVLDYPNRFDELEGNEGSGIWLHATDTPQHAQLLNDTRGCVVVDNSTMEELTEYIALGTTPIVILHSAADLPADPATLTRELGAVVQAWRVQWEDGNLAAYMAFYSESFRGDGMTKAAWQHHKAALAGRYQWIRVQFRDVSILALADQAVVNFTQVYQSDVYEDIGRKRVYWRREAGHWRIIGEEWSPLPPATLAENQGAR